MNKLTTIAALPGMGAGCAAAHQLERLSTLKASISMEADAAAMKEFCDSLIARVFKGEITGGDASLLAQEWIFKRIAVNVVGGMVASPPGQAILAAAQKGDLGPEKKEQGEYAYTAVMASTPENFLQGVEWVAVGGAKVWEAPQ